jgi:MoxR-like ATPase
MLETAISPREFIDTARAIETEVGKVIVGQGQVIRGVLICLISGGHALLEAMQEHRVTAGRGVHPLPEPFFVLATQNPIEMEGTYPLPEAQLDRFFFKLHVPFPHADELREIARRTTSGHDPEVSTVADGAMLQRMTAFCRELPLAAPVLDYAVRLVMRTHPEEPSSPQSVKQYVRYGSSPRGLQAIVLGSKVRALLENRFNVALEDLRAVAPAALRHRVLLNFEADAEGVSADRLIAEVVETTRDG